MEKLSIKECFSFAWQTFKSRPWIFIQAGLLLFLINMAVNLLQTLAEMGTRPAGEPFITIVTLGAAIVGVGISFLISMGETAFFLRSHDDVNAVSLRTLWNPSPFWKFLGVSLLSGLCILVGLIFLIVPGIILGILFMFVGYLVIEEKLGPIDAMKKSIALTKGNRLQLFLLSLVVLGLNILGFFALLLGLFISIPVSFLMTVHAYRVLNRTEQPEALVADVA